MIAELAVVLALGAQDVIHTDVSGSRRWQVALEGSGGAVAFTPTARDGDTREVVLITTAWIAEAPGTPPVLLQRFFVNTLDCKAWSQAQTGFGLTEPPPRRWSPMDGPPPARPVAVPKAIESGTAMATIAETVCREVERTLPEVEGEWRAVSTALRQRVEALSPESAASEQ